MAIPKDTELYEIVKFYVYSIYKKNSAYRSGMIQKMYKQLGGRYVDNGERKLARWYQEKWEDVNPDKTESSYPVYRPTKRVTKETPKTSDEIPKKRLEEQAKLKQKIKGKKNLPKF